MEVLGVQTYGGFVGKTDIRFRVIAFNPSAYALQVFGGGYRPPDFHQPLRKRRKRWPTCL
jgi:hypothetical protein